MSKKLFLMSIITIALLSCYVFFYNETTLDIEHVTCNDDRTVFELSQADNIYTQREPQIIVTVAPDTAAIDQYIPQNQQQILDTYAQSPRLFIAAFQGALLQSAHGIDIQHITLSRRGLRVYVFMHNYQKIVGPGGGTSDFEIVAIDRADLPVTDGPITVNMIDQHGDVIATTTFEYNITGE